MSQGLQLRNLHIALGQRTLVAGLDLSIAPGELLALTGASGSGKSSVLAWLSGVLDPAFDASGALWVDGQRLDTLPCERRRLGLLFQDALLFPHLSTGENLLFGMPPGPRAARRARATDALAEAGLSGHFDSDPDTLSGGQRARVSLLRTLLAEPRALLLDEPYSRLDPALRAQFRDWVLCRARARALPVLLVTHDLDDIPAGGRRLDMQQLADPEARDA